MVVPQQKVNSILVYARKARDIGFFPYTVFDNGLERHTAITLDRHPITLHLREHAKHIQYRQVDAICRQHAKAGEVRLTLKLKGPGQNSLEIYSMFFRQLVSSSEAGGSVARVHRGVAITKL